jgi:hypothetical protein
LLLAQVGALLAGEGGGVEGDVAVKKVGLVIVVSCGSVGGLMEGVF